MSGLPVLVSVPHGSTAVPDEVAHLVVATPQEILEDGDPFTEELYDLGDEVVALTRAGVARAVLDLNRDRSDLAPGNPDGAVKSQTCWGAPIWRDGLAPAEVVADLLDHHHAPYHARLDRLSRREVRFGIDCHSMASRPPGEEDGPERPPICLSDGEGTTAPAALTARLAEALAVGLGLQRTDVAVNEPFRGGYITRSHGRTRKPWVQLEVNRRLYLTSEHPPVLDPTGCARVRQAVLAALIEGVDAVGRTR